MKTVTEMLENIQDEIITWIRLRLIREQNPTFLEIIRIAGMSANWIHPNQVLLPDFSAKESRELIQQYLYQCHFHQEKDWHQIGTEIQRHVDQWESVYKELFQSENRKFLA